MVVIGRILQHLPVALLAGLLVAAARPAAGITVTTSDDSGAGSLREALVDASANAGPDTIAFDAALSGATITLTTGPLIVDDADGVTVDGSALTNGITIHGNGTDRIFYNTFAGTLTLRALTLTGGFTDTCCGGAAVLNQGAAIILDRCTLTGNTAGYGPAVFTDSGGGSSTTLRQCTLSANHATILAGAVYNRGTTTLIHCTVAGNSSAGNAGAVYNDTGTALTLENCIIGDNSAPATDDVQNEGALTVSGANIVTSAILHGLDATVDGSGTVTNVAPQLATLDNYGGPTATRPPLPDSPAIDAAVGSTETADQRGVSRPVDGDGNGSAVADLGAVEADEAFYVGLTNLVLSVGTLTPAFDGTITNYLVANLPGSTMGITITATATDTNATITVNDSIVVASGIPSGSIPLQLGNNLITVAVIAAGNAATNTYTIRIPLTLVRHVWPGSPNPAAPFERWDNAAHDIQSAIDAAFAGDTVLVTNGTYATGGRVLVGAMTNRVVIGKAVTVTGVNGPAVTTILGAWDPLTTNGHAAVRCVYVGTNAVLTGFTLGGGGTRKNGDAYQEQYGGGAWCEDSAIVSNCVLSGNTAWFGGGGAIGGTLQHCTLIGNTANEGSGGGAYLSTLNNCLVISNSASTGGGAFHGTANRCTFTENSALYGGAKVNGTMNNCLIVGNTATQQGGGTSSVGLHNCTVTGNSAPVGGGVDSSLCRNSIVYFNSASTNANFNGGAMTTSCTTPAPGGTGNITNNPQFIATNDFRLTLNSPCADIGDNFYAPAGTDLGGNVRIVNAIVDLGVYELPPQAIAVLGTNGAVIASGDATPDTADGTDFGVVNLLTFGPITRTFAITNSGGGTLVLGEFIVAGSNAADFVVLDPPASVGHGHASNLVVRCLPMSPGARNATLSITNDSPDNPLYTFALAAWATNGPATRYAATNSPSPTPPYTNWQTAAHVLQDAIDWAYVGDRVVVTNGVYAIGGKAIAGDLTNRAAIDKVITMESVNGPAVTTIQGAGPNGAAAVRCVYLKGGAVLVGFTLRGGATRTAGDAASQQSGGGLWAPGFFAVVSNCVFSGNSAASGGGGAYGVYARFHDCIFTNNTAALGGGIYDAPGCMFSNCTMTANSASLYGGGAVGGAHYNANFIGNTAAQRGGGIYGGSAFNSRLTGNKTTQSVIFSGGAISLGNLEGCLVAGNTGFYGGGASYGTIRNCTVVGNTGLDGGGTYRSDLRNSIVYGNTASFGTANAVIDGGGGSADYSCTVPLLGGAGNIALDPMLDPTNAYRLTLGSPCRDAGNNTQVAAGPDLDGSPRVANFTVDMGAYEYQFGPPVDYDGDGIPSWWEAQKGLSAVVSNGASSDADWMTDLQEYVADTDPNNAASYFPPIALTNAPPGNLALLINPTSIARVYSMSAATNLLDAPPVWQLLAPEQTGTAGAIVFTITNSVPARFYRTGVRLPGN